MHANARLTVWARREIVRRHLSGVTQVEIARQMGVSRATVSKWWQRYRQAPDGVWYVDRSWRPRSCPHQTPAVLEAAIVTVRQTDKLGPARIGYRLGVASSTVWKVLARHRLNRLAWLDRPTGEPVRRYEKSRPGELIHVDTKQVARIPEGGGWRIHGLEHHNRAESRRKSRGYEHVHAAVDDHTRLGYVETLPDNKGATCAAFWQRAHRFFADQGISVEAVIKNTPNGSRSIMTKETGNVIGGVDTHKHFHHAAVIATTGQLLGVREFESDFAGYQDLLAWMRSHGAIDAIGIEGTGFYGAALTQFLQGDGQRVVEVNRPNPSARRADGKSDRLDAEQAARAVLRRRRLRCPKPRPALLR